MNSIFITGLCVLGGLTFLSMIRAVVFQRKLWNHLRESHTDKWKELTYAGDWRRGLSNGLKSLTFLFNRDCFDDAEVVRLKAVTRNSFIFELAGFFGLFIWSSFMAGIIARL